MTIRLADGTEIDNVTLCAPNSFDGALVIEIAGADIPRMAELTALLGSRDKAAVIVSVNGKGIETAYAGYGRMKAVGYDGARQALTVWMDDR